MKALKKLFGGGKKESKTEKTPKPSSAEPIQQMQQQQTQQIQQQSPPSAPSSPTQLKSSSNKPVVQVDASIQEKVISNDANVKPITSIAKSTVDVSLLERFILKEIKKTTYGSQNNNEESSKPLSYASSSGGASYKNDQPSTTDSNGANYKVAPNTSNDEVVHAYKNSTPKPQQQEEKSEQSDPSASAYKNLKQPAQNDANAYKNHESTSDSKESETVKSDEPVSATNYKNATTSTPESSDNSVAYKNVQQNNSSTENSEPSSTAYKNSGNNASQEENKPTQTQKPREIVEARKADLLQGARNWNEDFQNVLKIKDSAERAVAISNLCNGFVEVAKKIAKILITEKNLPADQRTIRPMGVGGIAGGKKFVQEGIIFKFALDESHNLYPSTEFCMKAASAELKGLMSFIEAQVDDLAFPLMALVDFLGYRVIATSILPIDGSTLVFGSSDAGRTVHDSSPELRSKIEVVSKMLNLKAHNFRGTTFTTPVDLEGHKARDNRFYVVDTARLFPPTYPMKGGGDNQYLWNLFRPEFLKQYCVDFKLSSDAFSGFGSETLDEDEKEVSKATAFLFFAVVPYFSRVFEETENTNFSAARLKESVRKLKHDLHRSGINMRYLGLVRSHMKNFKYRTEALVLILSRVFKNELRHYLRSVQISDPSEHLKVVVSFVKDKLLNHEYWRKELKEKTLSRFAETFSEEELKDSFDLSSDFDTNHMQVLLELISEESGVRIRSEYITKITNVFLRIRSTFPEEVETHQFKFKTKLKPMNFVLQDEASSLMRTAIAQHGSQDSDAMLKRARNLFEQCMRVKPDDYVALTNWGSAETEYARCLGNVNGATSAYTLAIAKFQDALQIKPDYYEALYGWGLCNFYRCTAPGFEQSTLKTAKGAAEALYQCAQKWESNVEAHYFLGLALYEFGSFAATIKELDFSNPEFTISLPKPFDFLPNSPIRTLTVTKAFEMCGQEFEKCLKLDPKHSNALYTHSKALISEAEYLLFNDSKELQKPLKKVLDAEQMLGQAINISQNNFEILRFWSIIHQKLDKKLPIKEQRGDLSLLKKNYSTASVGMNDSIVSLMQRKLESLKNQQVTVEVRNAWELAPDIKSILAKNSETGGGNQNSHKWTVHLRQLDSENQMFPIQNVEFYLHQSFFPNHLVMEPPGPYRVTRLGWGTFKVPIVLNFDPLVSDFQVQIYHDLVFGPGGSPVFVFKIDMATGYCVDTSTGKRIWPRDEDLPVLTAKATHTKVAVPVSKSKEKVEMPSKKKVSVPVSKAKSKVAVPMSKTAVDHYNEDSDDSSQEDFAVNRETERSEQLEVHVETLEKKPVSMPISKTAAPVIMPTKKAAVVMPSKKAAVVMPSKKAVAMPSKKEAKIEMPTKKAVHMPVSKTASPYMENSSESDDEPQFEVRQK